MQQGAWIAAEACKVRDGLFLGNVMAVQDPGFILSNKICTVIKCQKGFTVPKRLRSAGVQYSVINLLEAFLDPSIPDDTKDQMLEGLYQVVEEASDAGLGVLFYCFQDFVWCSFCVMAFFIRKYRWTTEKAWQLLQMKRPGMEMDKVILDSLDRLVERMQRKIPPPTDEQEKRDLACMDNTLVNAKPIPNPTKTNGRPPSAARLRWVDAVEPAWGPRPDDGGMAGAEHRGNPASLLHARPNKSILKGRSQRPPHPGGPMVASHSGAMSAAHAHGAHHVSFASGSDSHKHHSLGTRPPSPAMVNARGGSTADTAEGDGSGAAGNEVASEADETSTVSSLGSTGTATTSSSGGGGSANQQQVQTDASGDVIERRVFGKYLPSPRSKNRPPSPQQDKAATGNWMSGSQPAANNTRPESPKAAYVDGNSRNSSANNGAGTGAADNNNESSYLWRYRLPPSVGGAGPAASSPKISSGGGGVMRPTLSSQKKGQRPSTASARQENTAANSTPSHSLLRKSRTPSPGPSALANRRALSASWSPSTSSAGGRNSQLPLAVQGSRNNQPSSPFRSSAGRPSSAGQQQGVAGRPTSASRSPWARNNTGATTGRGGLPVPASRPWRIKR